MLYFNIISSTPEQGKAHLIFKTENVEGFLMRWKKSEKNTFEINRNSGKKGLCAVATILWIKRSILKKTSITQLEELDSPAVMAMIAAAFHLRSIPFTNVSSAKARREALMLSQNIFFESYTDKIFTHHQVILPYLIDPNSFYYIGMTAEKVGHAFGVAVLKKEEYYIFDINLGLIHCRDRSIFLKTFDVLFSRMYSSFGFHSWICYKFKSA